MCTFCCFFCKNLELKTTINLFSKTANSFHYGIILIPQIAVELQLFPDALWTMQEAGAVGRRWITACSCPLCLPAALSGNHTLPEHHTNMQQSFPNFLNFPHSIPWTNAKLLCPWAACWLPPGLGLRATFHPVPEVMIVSLSMFPSLPVILQSQTFLLDSAVLRFPSLLLFLLPSTHFSTSSK